MPLPWWSQDREGGSGNGRVWHVSLVEQKEYWNQELGDQDVWDDLWS